MDKFIVNIIHRPEMVPEYSATVTGQGKEEDIGDKKLITESLDIFKTQQRLAHEAGLKTTIQMTYASLFNDEAVELAKQDHEKYGDEIALSLLGLPCEEFREKYKTKDFCIWMFSMEDKKAIVMMFSRNSMTDSVSILSQQARTIWMQTLQTTSKKNTQW